MSDIKFDEKAAFDNANLVYGDQQGLSLENMVEQAKWQFEKDRARIGLVELTDKEVAQEKLSYGELIVLNKQLRARVGNLEARLAEANRVAQNHHAYISDLEIKLVESDRKYKALAEDFDSFTVPAYWTALKAKLTACETREREHIADCIKLSEKLAELQKACEAERNSCSSIQAKLAAAEERIRELEAELLQRRESK